MVGDLSINRGKVRVHSHIPTEVSLHLRRPPIASAIVVPSHEIAVLHHIVVVIHLGVIEVVVVVQILVGHHHLTLVHVMWTIAPSVHLETWLD